jgi:hypothetical protein
MLLLSPLRKLRKLAYPHRMTRAISQDEFIATVPEVLSAVGEGSFVIEDEDGEMVAALVSPEEYEVVRRARAEDAIAAMRALGEQIRALATPEEIDELERALDRKA